MSYFFANHFRQALFNDPTLAEGAVVRLRLLRTAPSLASAASTQWLEASTVDELLTYIGWEEVTGIGGYPEDMEEITLSVRKDAGSVNNYALFTEYHFGQSPPVSGDGLEEPVRIEGFGIEYVGDLDGVPNPLIFVTNTPIGDFVNLDPGDKLTANPDTTLGAAANKWLFAWADPVAGAITVNPIEGSLALLRAAPIFEGSNSLHVWLYPQRANMIANPSFEYDTSHWAPVPTRLREAPFAPVRAGEVAIKTDLLTLTPEVGDMYVVEADDHYWEYLGPDPNDHLGKWQDQGVPIGKGWCGLFTQSGPEPLAIESNVWETRMGYDDHELWTLQLMAQGSGRLKVGLVSWDVDYRSTNVDWGTELWDLVPDAWIHATCIRYGPQAHTAMMRVEAVSGGTTQSLKLDRVLAERGALKEYPYFDGDERYGALDDFSWYGGQARRGISYSMWYGNRRSVIGRMFATPTDTDADAPADLVTDVDVMNAGMVYEWVPAGVTVIPHMDVFYPTDLKGPLAPRRLNVLPPSSPDDPLGVEDPWAPEDLPEGVWRGSQATISVTGVSENMVHGIRPTVTINKAAGQADPSTTTTTVTFDVVFSEPVTGFTNSDVTLGGTAGPTTAVVAGSGAVYTVTVSGMVTDGTVTAAIPANAAQSATADQSQTSTSTDNSVSWFDPLKQLGWWGIAYSGRTTYTKQIGGGATGRVKLAGAGAAGAGGACVVDVNVGTYVVSIGESVNGSPNSIIYNEETWGFGGPGGNSSGGPTTAHGGGRTEIRTSAARASAIVIAPGGGNTGQAGTGGIGGFPDGTPATSTGGGYSGYSGTGGTATAAGAGGMGYGNPAPGTGTSGANGDTGSGLGAGGRGGNGVYSFGPGGHGGGAGAGYHGGGGGAGADGSSDYGRGAGGGSGYTGGAAAVLNTFNGVSGALGVAAMQVRQGYSDKVRAFLVGSSPRTYIPCEEGAETGCIVVSDVMNGYAFWDREAATLFDGTAASLTQMFQGHTINGRGAAHVSRNGSHRSPDFQMRAVEATSLYWNPPALNAGNSWAIEWTQQTISGNADGPGTQSVTTAGTYTNATSGQMPWKVAADATSISLSLATTSLGTVVAASATFPSHATTIITRYGISYNAATDTFHFYRSDNQTNTKTRTAAGLPTTGQWNAATYRPLLFSSITGSAESRMQDVALFDSHRNQDQFNASCAALGVFVQTFGYTGSAQTFIVPPGVYEIESELDGAQGGSIVTGGPTAGGKGGHLLSKHAVTPGETIQVNVGGEATAATGAAAFGGGGISSGAASTLGMAGGGGTDIRRTPYALGNRLAIAGAGGGAGAGHPNGHPNAIGGDGAGNGNGVKGQDSDIGQLGGGGATPSAGGAAGGTGGTWSGIPQPGTLGLGGASGDFHGGGGGGGLYGGGGGPGNVGPGGGGGGSGGITSGALISATTGTRLGHGQAIIRWAMPSYLEWTYPGVINPATAFTWTPPQHIAASLVALQIIVGTRDPSNGHIIQIELLVNSVVRLGLSLEPGPGGASIANGVIDPVIVVTAGQDITVRLGALPAGAAQNLTVRLLYI